MANEGSTKPTYSAQQQLMANCQRERALLVDKLEAAEAEIERVRGLLQRRVYQTKFGNGNGDCLLACVATVLGRELADIPDFTLGGCGWFEDLYEWCLNENIGLVLINPKDLANSLMLNSLALMVFSVVGNPNEDHAVVGKCVRVETPTVNAEDAAKWHWECDIAHDPNPQGVKLGELQHLIFLIPTFPQSSSLVPQGAESADIGKLDRVDKSDG